MLFPFLPPRVHGVIDYVLGLFFVASPWVFGFTAERLAIAVPIVVGVGTILYSLLTDHPLAVKRVIPMFIHLWLDVGAGLLILLSPFLLGFSGYVRWPFITMGALEIGLAVFSRNKMILHLRHRDDDVGHHTTHGRPGMA